MDSNDESVALGELTAATEELDALDVRTLESSRLLEVRRTFDG